MTQLAVCQIDSASFLAERIQLTTDPAQQLALQNQLSALVLRENLTQADKATLNGLLMAEKLPGSATALWAIAYRSYYLYLSGQLASAKNLLEDAMPEQKNSELERFVLLLQGNILTDAAQYDSAKSYFDAALRLNTRGHDGLYFEYQSLMDYWLIMDYPDSAIAFADKGLALAVADGDSLRVVKWKINQVTCLHQAGRIDEARKLLLAVETPAMNTSHLRFYFQLEKGFSLNSEGTFTEALRTWRLALNEFNGKVHKYKIGYLLFQLGTTCENLGYFDLAIEYLNSGYRLARDAGFEHLVGDFLHEQSWVYYRTHNYETARQLSQRARKIFIALRQPLDEAACNDLMGLVLRRMQKPDSSIYYHELGLQQRLLLNKKVDISASYFNIGEFYLNTNNFKQALAYYKKSERIDTILGDKYGLSLNYNRMGKVFTSLSQYDSAYHYLMQGLQLAVPVSANEVLHDSYLDLAAYYEKTGDLKQALQYYKKYQSLADTLFNKNTAQSLASYRALLDVERNEQDLKIMGLERERDRALIERQSLFVVILISGIIAILIILLAGRRINRKLRKLNFNLAEKHEEIQAQSEELKEANDVLSRLNQEVTEQKEMIERQTRELIQNNQAIKLANEQLEARVEARTFELRQAFKELDTFFYRSSHDFRRPLTTFMGLAEVARVLVKDPLALELFTKVDENARNLDKMLRKLQSVSDAGTLEGVMKEVDLYNLIQVSIEKFQEELDRFKVRLHVEFTSVRLLTSYPPLISIAFENLLENALSFRNEKNPEILIRVTDSITEESICLEVIDNGPGIDPEFQSRIFEMYFRASEQSKGNGLGLYIVRKIVAKLSGQIECISSPETGTTFRMTIPCHPPGH